MAVVKGSKQTSLRVVNHDAKKLLRQRLVLVLLCASLAAASFLAGQFSAWNNQQEVNAQRDQLLEDIVASNAEVIRMSQRMAILEKGGEVDRTATESVRQTVINLRSQVATLEEEIIFYKGIMAPSSNKRGLAIQKLELNKNATGGYQYKVVLTQIKDNRAQIKGLLALNFIGMKSGKEVVLPLKDVSDKVKDLGTKFRFKYFQDIQGTFVFPKGFKPIKVQVVVQSSGKNSTRIEEVFDWNVEKSN